jgi:hypothetical protein
LIRRHIPLASVEAEHLIRYNNAEDKKADLKIRLPNGETFFVDVTIFNPGSRSYQKLSPEAVMKGRERSKRDQYKKVGFDLSDPRLIPFVLDVTGNIGPCGLAFIDKLHSFAEAKYPFFKLKLFRRINVALAFGLAKTVLSFNSCLSTAPESFEGGQGSDRFLSSKSLNKLITSSDGGSDDEGGGLEILLGYDVGRK